MDTDAMSEDDPSSHDTPGCGIWWLWQKIDDPFQDACYIHDADYDKRIAGDKSIDVDEVDKAFLDNMLKAADGSVRLKIRAYFFYSLACVWGKTVRRKLWNS